MSDVKVPKYKPTDHVVFHDGEDCLMGTVLSGGISKDTQEWEYEVAAQGHRLVPVEEDEVDFLYSPEKSRWVRQKSIGMSDEEPDEHGENGYEAPDLTSYSG